MLETALPIPRTSLWEETPRSSKLMTHLGCQCTWIILQLILLYYYSQAKAPPPVPTPAGTIQQQHAMLKTAAQSSSTRVRWKNEAEPVNDRLRCFCRSVRLGQICLLYYTTAVHRPRLPTIGATYRPDGLIVGRSSQSSRSSPVREGFDWMRLGQDSR